MVVVEGRQYVRLARHSDVLYHFFTAQSRGLAPLAGNPVFDQIAALRHDFLLNFGKDDAKVEEHDTTDDLGLDATDDEGLAPMCGRSRRNLRVVSKALPTDFEAMLPRPGQSDWRFRMLCERGNRAPCIEATSGNFDVLFCSSWFRSLLSSRGRTEAPQPSSLRGGALVASLVRESIGWRANSDGSGSSSRRASRLGRRRGAR